MSDKVYHTTSKFTNADRELLEIALDVAIFAEKHTGRKIAKRIGMTPEGFSYHVKRRKTGGSK